MSTDRWTGRPGWKDVWEDGLKDVDGYGWRDERTDGRMDAWIYG
jgi:hypothetical protein